jgi:hypothetical protein
MTRKVKMVKGINNSAVSSDGDGRGKSDVVIRSQEFSVPVFKLLNLYYPLFWVLISLPIFIGLLYLPVVVDKLLIAHVFLSETIPVLSSFNSKNPYNSDLAKSYTVILVFLIPLQIFSLTKVRNEDFLISFRKKDERHMFLAFFMFLFCLLFLLIIGPDDGGFYTRILGSGYFSVAVMLPLFTSLLPFIIRIAVFLLKNRSQKINTN